MAKELAEHVEDDEEPSRDWGWHGSFPRGALVAGWACVAILLAMLVGNHAGNVENIWLIGLAAVMAYGLVRHSLRKRHPWRH